MLDRYLDFINHHLSDTNHKKLLLTVSGGVDSMVMLDLSIRAKLPIAVAHVNHDMRGEESDKDEKLVREICIANEIQLHTYRFTPEDKPTKSFQEHARNLRYTWWNKLCDSAGYKYILTAHHKSDAIETFLFNLSRGAGIKGLSSIPNVNQNILRPLNPFTKAQIIEYAKLNAVKYREDSSNQEIKYERNKIRNITIPYLKSIDPNIEDAIAKSIANLSKEQSLLKQLVHSTIDSHTEMLITGYQSIKINQLIQKYKSDTSQLLYQYLNVYGFTEDNCNKCITADVGAEFHSDTHDLLKDRGTLLLRKKTLLQSISLEVDKYGQYQLTDSTQLIISNEFTKDSMAINGLKFPFIVRHKQSGDKFCPAGMKGATQKLKDFLTNSKLNKWSKQDTLVIVDSNTIAAVLPLRVAHDYAKPIDHSCLYISLRYN